MDVCNLCCIVIHCNVQQGFCITLQNRYYLIEASTRDPFRSIHFVTNEKWTRVPSFVLTTYLISEFCCFQRFWIALFIYVFCFTYCVGWWGLLIKRVQTSSLSRCVILTIWWLVPHVDFGSNLCLVLPPLLK